MKNKNVIFAVGVGLLIVILLIVLVNVDGGGEGSSSSEDVNAIVEQAQKDSEAATEDKMRDFDQIDIDKYLEIYEGDSYELVLFARDTCGYCQIDEPILKTILYENEGLEIHYVDTDALGDDGSNKLYQSNTETFESFGTPLLLIVRDKVVVDKVDGLTDKEHYEDFLKTYNFIK